jgi:hypothetical protein
MTPKNWQNLLTIICSRIIYTLKSAWEDSENHGSEYLTHLEIDIEDYELNGNDTFAKIYIYESVYTAED